jgi:hypothetical protein
MSIFVFAWLGGRLMGWEEIGKKASEGGRKRKRQRVRDYLLSSFRNSDAIFSFILALSLSVLPFFDLVLYVSTCSVPTP